MPQTPESDPQVVAHFGTSQKLWDMRFEFPEDINKHLRNALGHVLSGVPTATFLTFAESLMRDCTNRNWPVLRKSTLRMFLEGRLTEGQKPVTILSHHEKRIELVCSFLDVLETMRQEQYGQAKTTSSGAKSTATADATETTEAKPATVKNTFRPKGRRKGRKPADGSTTTLGTDADVQAPAETE